jgi:radical SAM protein with 4Fe4S-binding SPASM domain
MDYEIAKNIVLILKDIGINTVVLIGGEPTLWKDLFKFNDFCNSLSVRTSIVTNAYAFRSDDFLQEYLKHPNTHVETSLKSFDEQSSLLITRIKDFEGMKTGIQRATSKFKSQVSIVYSTLVENDLLKMVSTAVDLGAQYVRVGVCTPMSIDGKFVAPFTVTYDKMVSEISTNYKKMVDITRGKLSFALNSPLCIWPKDFVKDIIEQNRIGIGCQFRNRLGVVFDPRGKVLLCNNMFDCPVGEYGVDFNDSKTLLALLNSKEVDGFYKHINSYPSKICIDCDLYPRCRGGCPIVWTVYNAEEIISAANNKERR